MSFQSPFKLNRPNPRLNHRPNQPPSNRPTHRPAKKVQISDRSPAANPLRQYGPFVTGSKTLVKFLSLGALGFGISMLMFAAFDNESSVNLLIEIWKSTWKPLIAVTICLGMLAAIEESFH
jgi:hypothetical protein